MVGFLLQWPTIPTLVMFPILVAVYVRLARSEEGEVAARFGERWAAYAASTPGFLPRRRHGDTGTGGAEGTGPDADGRASAGRIFTRTDVTDADAAAGRRDDGASAARAPARGDHASRR
nr:hypothetical protein [Pseudofrankia sp. BMG5.36]